MYTSYNNASNHSLQSIVNDIIAGSKLGSEHFSWFSRYFIWDCFLSPTLKFIGLNSNNEDSSVTTTGELKVIGVGYGRTGTYSLAKALERLGYPTLHTQHLYRHYDIMKMWMREVVEPSIEAGTIMMGKPDWNAITSEGFEATADFPSSLYFEELMEFYPNAKFILTTKGPGRSIDWFRSWEGMTQAALQSVYVSHHVLSQMEMYGKYFRWLMAHVNQNNEFLTKPFPIHSGQDSERSITSYEAHNELVRMSIPPHRLLEYNLKDGWEPLCQFLEVDACPLNETFPTINSALCKHVESLSSILYAVAITSLILFTLVAWVCRITTGKSVIQWMATRHQEKKSKIH